MISPEQKTIGVYIHIPFCISKCNYCDFLSFPASEKVQERYMHALLRELDFVFTRHPKYQARTVFIGGGTPSVVAEGWIRQIMERIPGDKQECTIEVNPGTVTGERLAGYRRAGLNRLSIGLQSADDRQLKVLGRIHQWKDFMTTFTQAREAGFTNINIDLMSALPGQSLSSWQDTLEKAAALAPEHISAYSLIIEEGTPFYESCPDLPDEEEERKMYYATDDFLKKQGYERYEISNYARPGFACRHNIGYWERQSYLGFGLGAASLMDNIRWKNTSDMEQYIQGCSHDEINVAQEIHPLSAVEQEEEYLFLGMRLCAGVSKDKFRQLFGREITGIYGPALKKLEQEGLIIMDDNIRLTERGIDVSNYVLANFLQD